MHKACSRRKTWNNYNMNRREQKPILSWSDKDKIAVKITNCAKQQQHNNTLTISTDKILFMFTLAKFYISFVKYKLINVLKCTLLWKCFYYDAIFKISHFFRLKKRIRIVNIYNECPVFSTCVNVLCIYILNYVT